VPVTRGDLNGGSALAAAIERSQGEFVAVISAGVSLRPTAVQMGLAFPRFSQFNFGRVERQYAAREGTLQLFEEITDLVPPEHAYALVHEHIELPGLTTSREQILFAPGERDSTQAGNRPRLRSEPPSGDTEAIEELERVRAKGASFLVFSWTATSWLERYPGFADHLRSTARRARESDRLVAFDLRP
jgi:hypothetical protein